MWLLISGNIPCEIYRQFNIHHPICLPAQISLNMLVHCSCPFMGLYLAWVQCGLCSKKLCFLWCQSVLKGLIDVWEYVLSTRRASMMGPATDQWNRAQEDSQGLLYKWGWSHFYSPKTESLFSLFLVMWYPMHPLHIPNANSLCLLTDTCCKGTSMCIRAQTNAYVYTPHSNGYAFFTWWSIPLGNALSVIGQRMNKPLGSQPCLKALGKNKNKK